MKKKGDGLIKPQLLVRGKGHAIIDIDVLGKPAFNHEKKKEDQKNIGGIKDDIHNEDRNKPL